jgi:hypothetical protein
MVDLSALEILAANVAEGYKRLSLAEVGWPSYHCACPFPSTTIWE